MSARHRRKPDNAAVDAQGFRRVHPLTPLLRFWTSIVAIATVLILNLNFEMATEAVAYLRGGHIGEALKGVGLAAAVFVVACLIIWWVSRVWWRQLGFKLTEEEISIRRGVISTSFRSARYDRTQAVDVVEHLFPRLFGLAAVRIETAGGAGSAIEVAYLNKAQAEELRAEVLRRVRGVCNDGSLTGTALSAPSPADGGQVEAAGGGFGGAVAQDDEVVVPEIPIGRSMVAAALRLSTLLLVAFVVSMFALPVPSATSIPFLVGVLPNIWNLLDSSWRYTARLSRDEKTGARVLNVSYGLADLRRQSIRLSRIHGVKVAQPLLWRMFGWYEVQVSVAGYGAKGGGKQSGSTRIVPVGSREQAMALFALVSDLSAEEVEELARPEGPTAAQYRTPKRAWLATPLDWHKQGVTLVRDNAVTHAGLITRHVCAINTSHIQELTYKAGPIAQALRVGTVRFELVNGPVRMRGEDLAPADAADLMRRLRARQLPGMAETT